MEKPQTDRKIIRQRTESIPLAGEGDSIDEKTALAIIQDLIASKSHIPDHIRQQIHEITEEISEKLDQDPNKGMFEVSAINLRAIIARAAIAGAAQAVNDTGQSYLEAKILSEMLVINEDGTRTGSEED